MFTYFHSWIPWMTCLKNPPLRLKVDELPGWVCKTDCKIGFATEGFNWSYWTWLKRAKQGRWDWCIEFDFCFLSCQKSIFAVLGEIKFSMLLLGNTREALFEIKVNKVVFQKMVLFLVQIPPAKIQDVDKILTELGNCWLPLLCLHRLQITEKRNESALLDNLVWVDQILLSARELWW